jgi:hypothetical protein
MTHRTLLTRPLVIAAVCVRSFVNLTAAKTTPIGLSHGNQYCLVFPTNSVWDATSMDSRDHNDPIAAVASRAIGLAGRRAGYHQCLLDRWPADLADGLGVF